jgi:hypothetical protein
MCNLSPKPAQKRKEKQGAECNGQPQPEATANLNLKPNLRKAYGAQRCKYCCYNAVSTALLPCARSIHALTHRDRQTDRQTEEGRERDLCGEALAFLALSGKHLLLVPDLILCSLPLLLHTHTHTHTHKLF